MTPTTRCAAAALAVLAALVLSGCSTTLAVVVASEAPQSVRSL